MLSTEFLCKRYNTTGSLSTKDGEERKGCEHRFKERIPDPGTRMWTNEELILYVHGQLYLQIPPFCFIETYGTVIIYV